MGPFRTENPGPEFEYLSVDEFMQDIGSGRALLTAFEIGLIDGLSADKRIDRDSLAYRLGMDEEATNLLVGILIQSGVLLKDGSAVSLTGAFTQALRFRDLMLLKLEISNFAAHDLLNHFTDMIADPRKAAGKMRFFRLFSCEKSLKPTEEDVERTKRWMSITTGFTRYEAQVCMKYHDFSAHRRMLDIGGNSGEFALQICKKHLEMNTTVLDLPVVCDIGREHVAHEPEAHRIAFISGDAVTDKLPSGFDIVTFKSMLHDWPDEVARRLIRNGSGALKPGGTILIFERGPLVPDDRPMLYSIIPFLLFFGSFRSPLLYEEQLRDLNFRDIEVRSIDLEMPFYLLTAKKGV